MREMDEEDLPAIEDFNEAVKEFYGWRSVWTEIYLKTSPIEERMMVLEEVVKKGLADPAQKATPAVISGSPTPRSYALVVPP